MSEKTEFAGWAFWIFFIVLIMVGITAMFKPAGMWWDRQVMLESHQYSEGRATEMATFKAQLVAVEMSLQTATDANHIKTLQAQRMMLIQQMSISKTRSGQKGIITKTVENF